MDNNDEFIEIISNGLMKKFYVIEAGSREEAIERYKQLKTF